MTTNGEFEPIASAAAVRRWRGGPRRIVGRPAHDNDMQDPESSDPTWRVLATFVVEFREGAGDQDLVCQSVAHHMESGETSQWDGIVSGPLLSWMLGRLVRSRDLEPSEDPHDD